MIGADDLAFIATIANHRTLAESARALCITPSSVTLRLQHIEKKLGLTIIHRPARKVSLTEEGELLLEKGRYILQSLEDLQSLMDQRKALVSGKLRVLAPLGFGSDHIAPLLAEYKQEHPELDIDLELSDSPTWANAEKWDLIIYIGALRDSSLKMITLAKNQRIICAAPSYLDSRGKPSTPNDLLKHQCIALRENDEDMTLWPFVDQQNHHHPTRIKPSLISNQGKVIKQWALSGMGIIMRSSWDVHEHLSKGELIQLLPDYTLPQANIVALLGSPVKARSARVSGFISLLKQQLPKRIPSQ